MEAIVRIGNTKRVVTPEQFTASCNRQGVRIKLSVWGRLSLCGYELPVRQARALLAASSELEAMLLVNFPSLADVLEERAAILGADGLPDALLDAARSLCGPWTPEDEIQEVKSI